MPILARPYRDVDDLAAMQALVQQSNAQTGGYGLLHTGDLPHRIFNILRNCPPSEIIRLWENKHRELLGWALAYPRFGGFDVLARPEYRYTPVEAEMFTWAEQQTRQLRNREGKITEWLETDVLAADAERCAWLTQRGYTTGEPVSHLTTRRLAEAIPDSQLPAGFSIRNVIDETDAEQLIAVHSGAFGSEWTVAAYRQVMRSPGYAPERELVVVAPDGRFAAFCILWLDPVNQTGLFEPVGTHPDFQRRGLGRALLREGLRQMCAAGLIAALVAHDINNPAAAGLYASVGFTSVHKIHSYRKTMV